ncbi:hypothetical protein P691DRAFT_770376 [Macrolepiota fuliginosa MF-IS2]|uniref:Uncharacterized protein n=1 Tax=Macrolepiota fuliginosa MF-IS2 TaxID=1400762 RepID=A0A9P5XSF4_9AGAR|nr:hypothetical protein P691DRAFT_770376 [Macrolepiota fuliginosa MF-IS2]
MLNLVTSSVTEIERVIVRAEVLHKKWTAPHPKMPGIRDPPILLTGTLDSTFLGSKGSYLIFYRKPSNPRNPASFCWFDTDDTGNALMMNPVFQYDFLLPRNCDFPSLSGIDYGLSARVDRKTGVLHAASVLEGDSVIFVTSIESGPKFRIETRKISISLRKNAFCHIKVIDDYILCRQKHQNEIQTIDIIHIQAWKKFRAVLRSKFLARSLVNPPGLPAERRRIQFAITSHYFIQILDSTIIEVYDLPGLSGWTSINPNSIRPVLGSEGIASGTDMRPIFSGPLPCTFIDLQVLPSASPSSLIIVGAGDLSRLDRDSVYRIALMSLDINQHSIQTLQEVLTECIVTRNFNQLTLTHAPATHCAAGIVVTVAHSLAESGTSVLRTIRYIQVSLGAEPEVSVNNLQVPTEVRPFSLLDADIFGGSLIFGCYEPYAGGIQKRVSILQYM